MNWASGCQNYSLEDKEDEMQDAWPIPCPWNITWPLPQSSPIPPPSPTYTLMENTEYGVGITELIVAILGTPANSLVIYLACYILSRTRRKQYGQWPVLTMTAFDLLFCLVHSPMMFAQLVHKSPFSVGLCTLMHFCTHASATGSSMSLLLLNLDKFVHLYKPLHYPSLVTRRRTMAACLLVSCLAFSWASFLMFGPFMARGVSPTGQCQMRLIVSEVYVFLAVMFFILPTLASLGISIFTASVVLRSRRSQLLFKKTKGDDCHSHQSEADAVLGKRIHTKSPKKDTSNRSPTSTPRKDIGTHSTKSPKKDIGTHSKTTKKEKYSTDAGVQKPQSFLCHFKIIGFVFTTTMWTSLTSLPYRIGYLWYVTRTTPLAPVEHLRMFAMFALMVCNAAGNPFVTIMSQHQYTEGTKKLIRRFLYSRSVQNSSCANTKLTGSPQSPQKPAGFSPSSPQKPFGFCNETNPFLQVPNVHSHLINGQPQLSLHTHKIQQV